MKLIVKKTDNTLSFSAEKCGITFDNIATVLEWRNENPLIQISKPLGMDAVYAILNKVEGIKHAARLTNT